MRCRVPRLRGTTRFHPSRRLAPQAGRRRVIDPDRIGLLSPPCRRVLYPDIRNAGSGRPASRTIASDTHGGGRSDRAGVPWSGCHPLAGCSGVVGHRLPPRAAAIRDRESARHAYALPNCVPSASWSSSLPVPLLGSRGRKRAWTPERSSSRNAATGRWGSTRRSTAPAPQSKTSSPCSRLVRSRAVVGLRAWAENPGRRASSRSTVLRLRAFM
jgi:hypothetical protein